VRAEYAGAKVVRIEHLQDIIDGVLGQSRHHPDTAFLQEARDCCADIAIHALVPIAAPFIPHPTVAVEGERCAP